MRFPIALLLTLLATCLVSGGCSSSENGGGEGGETAAVTSPRDGGEGAAVMDVPTDEEPVVLGDMLEPFDPPTLDELEKSVEWIENPVVDPMARLRAVKATEPPLTSVQEALRMRNDSPKANRQILGALSVVPPEDGRGVDYDATLNRALQMDLRSMNPLLGSSISEQDLEDLMAFNAFGFDWDLIPFALKDYVVSWHTSTDHMMDKVVLRDDMVWSDGQPITAHDVVFSFQLIMTSAVPIPSVRTGTDEIRWIEAYDDQTLVYFHKDALATNVWNLNFPVIPKHVYGQSYADDPTLRTSDYHRSLERNPVSGGRYEVVRWNRGQDVVLRRRESFYMHEGEQVRDRPYFKEMKFRIIEDGNTRLLALMSGDIDEAQLETEQWQTQTSNDAFYQRNTKVSGPEWAFFYIGWNLDTDKTPFFADVRVRRAMAYTLNYQELLGDLCYGLYQQCHGMFHPDSWMYPKTPVELYRQDLDKAEDLLDEAGWVDSDGDGIRDKMIHGRLVPFEFSLLVANKPDRIAICNLFRENLESIGIICNVTPLESAVLQERVFNKNFEASMAGWYTGADPFTNKNIFGTGAGRNFGAYSNPEVDRLFKTAMKEFDRDKQAELYGRIHELIFEDQPYLFLYNTSSLFGFNKKLRGYRFSPRGPFRYNPGLQSIWTP